MQMLAEDHLTLRLVRLKRFETWTNPGQGFSFVLAKGGSGRYVSSSAAQSLVPGDVLVLNGPEAGNITVANEEMIFWCFSVCVEHLFPLFAVGEICLLQNTAVNLKSPKHYPASSSLAQECHRLVETAPPQGNIDHRSQVLRVAAAVLSAEFKNVRRQRTGFARTKDQMIRVFEDLSTTELLTLSVGDVAHKFSCSRRHLNRLFHQHFGCSVASLRMEMRLLKALSLLRDPESKIIHVAEQCGFNHLGLFNACFKKRFGSTPGQWRKGPWNGESPVSNLTIGNLCLPLRANGLGASAPKPDAPAATAPKRTSLQGLNHSSGPANPKHRETILQEIRQVSAHIKYKSASGIKAQTHP